MPAPVVGEFPRLAELLALGLRSLRTASLPPSVTAAEGYRRVTVDDFRTLGRAAMIRRLGGVPELHDVVDGPRISVVVRTKDRPQLLAEALQSLAAGSYRRVEVVLVNDGGEPPTIPVDLPLDVVRVDLPVNRGRAGAANAGVEAATGDHVAFLDDDDLAERSHDLIPGQEQYGAPLVRSAERVPANLTAAHRNAPSLRPPTRAGLRPYRTHRRSEVAPDRLRPRSGGTASYQKIQAFHTAPHGL